MNINRVCALATPAFIAGFAAAPASADVVSGFVREHASAGAIAGAIVSLQPSGDRTVTAADGSFSLDLAAGTGLVIVGAGKGYYNQSVLVDTPATDVEILLEPVPQDNDPNYTLRPPASCGSCHPDQLSQWQGTGMAHAGVNAWVHDIYAGNGTVGGMGGFVYLRDSVHASGNPETECAACHQPESWIATPFSRLEGPDDIGYPSAAAVHGVSCDVCHKIADVDVTKINYPGIYPGVVTHTRPAGLPPNQVQYGVLGDVDFAEPRKMRASYQPQLVAEVCGACHQDKNDPDQNGDFEEPNGVISEPTYIEWVQSAYGADPESPTYTTCVDCHMPPAGETVVCNDLDPPLVRDAATVRSHTIEGTTAAYLENAVDLAMETQRTGDRLHVEVAITNSQTGHHVPTGVTVRNMILLVEAWMEGDDPLVDPLPHLGPQTIHDLGGVGDPAQGYYAGLPGKLYAKVNHDASLNGPTFFTDATGIQFDNRIPALATDTTNYTFGLPREGGTVHVRARLIYRRSFRFLVDAKQWTQDGHGNPLEDVAAPHYGHLMEMAEETIVVPVTVPTGSPAGTVIAALMLLAAGAIVIRSRRTECASA